MSDSTSSYSSDRRHVAPPYKAGCWRYLTEATELSEPHRQSGRETMRRRTHHPPQSDVGAFSGVSRAHVMQAEDGTTRPSMRVAEQRTLRRRRQEATVSHRPRWGAGTAPPAPQRPACRRLGASSGCRARVDVPAGERGGTPTLIPRWAESSGYPPELLVVGHRVLPVRRVERKQRAEGCLARPPRPDRRGAGFGGPRSDSGESVGEVAAGPRRSRSWLWPSRVVGMVELWLCGDGRGWSTAWGGSQRPRRGAA